MKVNTLYVLCSVKEWSIDGMVSQQKLWTESVNSFKNAYDRYCCKDMDDRSWSAAACRSIILQVQVQVSKAIALGSKANAKNFRLEQQSLHIYFSLQNDNCH